MSILFMVDFVFFKTKYFRGFLPIPNYSVLLLMIVKMAIESCNLHWLLIACCYQLPYHDVRNVFFALGVVVSRCSSFKKLASLDVCHPSKKAEAEEKQC